MLRTTSVTTRETEASGAAALRLRPGAITWREIDGELVLLDLDTSSYLNVNPAGTLLWPALERGTTEAALVTVITEHFDISAATAAHDVAVFVADVRERGYLAS